MGLATFAAYRNSFHGPFLFDGLQRIVHNPVIQCLWPLQSILLHSTRPVVRLTFAVNYALGGLDTFGYHLVNIFIHLCAGLLLYGLARRTLLSDRLRIRYEVSARWLAFAVAMLWLLHPMQTESVTYIYQRTESLMGMFYLLTLYSLNRAATAGSWRGWPLLAVTACFLGMGSKPIMVTAPLMALLYDRVFLAGSWREVWRSRWLLHVALYGTWLVLILVLSGSYESQKTSGFNIEAMGPWEYWRTQPQVLLHYLRLAVWPYPLVFDNAWEIAQGLPAIWGPLLLIGLMIGTVIWLLGRAPAAGFLGAWFFLTLAPSSVVPLTDLAFEHRMYLALAAVIAALVLAMYTWLRTCFASKESRRMAAFILLVATSLVLGLRTYHRNAVYQSRLSLWRDVVAKRPNNVRARKNLGDSFIERRQFEKALKQFQMACELDPHDAMIRLNLGTLLYIQGDAAGALKQLQVASHLDPDNPVVHTNLAEVLRLRRNLSGALAELAEALEVDESNPMAYHVLGTVFKDLDYPHEAVVCFRRAIALDPRLDVAYAALGSLLVRHGSIDEGAQLLRRAHALKPEDLSYIRKLATIHALADLEQPGSMRNLTPPSPRPTTTAEPP